MIVLPQNSGETARDYARRVISHNIIQMELKPGALVSETELAKELGISRTPVREAVIELCKTGMMEILPQRGTKVALIDKGYVEESRFYRLVIERAIVQEICESCDVNDFFPLVQSLSNQEYYYAKGDIVKSVETDIEFHTLLYKMADKDRNNKLLIDMFSQFTRIRYFASRHFDLKPNIDEHYELFNALKSKDKARADEIIVRHLSRYKRGMQFLEESFPTYFKKN